MSGLPDRTTAHSPQSYGRPAILRFVERVNREIGPSPSFTEPAISLPSPPSPPLPDTADRAGHVEPARLRAARRRAVECYPGPVGEVIARELEAAAAFGFRLTRGTLYRRLVDHLIGPQSWADPAEEADHGAAPR